MKKKIRKYELFLFTPYRSIWLCFSNIRKHEKIRMYKINGGCMFNFEYSTYDNGLGIGIYHLTFEFGTTRYIAHGDQYA